jgi:hypothetical protein
VRTCCWVGMGMHDRVFVAYERRDADEIRASGDPSKSRDLRPGRGFLIAVAGERIIRRQGAYIRAAHVGEAVSAGSAGVGARACAAGSTSLLRANFDAQPGDGVLPSLSAPAGVVCARPNAAP